MALNFTTTDRESMRHGIKVLVYGGPGTGKTTLCGTAPSPLIISAEAGLLSLRRKSIPVAIVTSIQDVWDVYTWCLQQARQRGIQTICLDSISEITEKVLEAAKKKARDPRAAYGDMATDTIELVKAFRDLSGFHVVVTAKETTKLNPMTGINMAEPTAPGRQVGPDLPYLFDEVLYAAIGQDQRTAQTFYYLRTRASYNAVAKDRSGALEDVEYPDLSHLFQKMLTAT